MGDFDLGRLWFPIHVTQAAIRTADLNFIDQSRKSFYRPCAVAGGAAQTRRKGAHQQLYCTKTIWNGVSKTRLHP